MQYFDSGTSIFDLSAVRAAWASQPHGNQTAFLVVQYLGVLKVNLWDYKGNILPQKRLKVTYSTTKAFE